MTKDTEVTEDAKYPYLYTGSFCVYYGHDDVSHQILMLISERGKKFKGTKSEGFGTAGGYVTVIKREQPPEAAVRETGEEITKPDGSPVLDTLTPDRMLLVDTAIDYDAGVPGTLYIGNVWHGHKCHLQQDEINKLKAHIEKMNSDPDYAEASRKAGKDETENLFLMTPDQVIKAIEGKKIKFAYAHEAKVVLAVAKSLWPVTPSAQHHYRV